MVTSDVIVIGGGHNGLIAALLLARRGLSVLVLEAQQVIGGAVRTERPFKNAPELGISSGSYLLGLMPPELMKRLGLDLPLRRRDPHTFVPTTGTRSLMLGADQAENKRQFTAFFSAADWDANEAMQSEIADLRNDLAPTWLTEPLTIEATAERFVRPALKQIFIDLCRKSVGEYLSRFDFKSDLVRALYATNDGLSGVHGTWSTPGTGMNFLIHNMCRLPSSDGSWMVVEGGMGTITQKLTQAAQRAGAVVHVKKKVQQILVEGNVAKGVVLEDGTELHASTIVCNADPFQMRELVGTAQLPAEYNARLDGYRRDGSSMKVNVALAGLPKFTCTDSVKVYGPTIHLLPEESDVMKSLFDGYEAVKDGKLPQSPTIEWSIHTTVDPTLMDPQGHHTCALFVHGVPYELTGTTWENEEAGYVKHLFSVCDRFAPGFSDLVIDYQALHPKAIEEYFGVARGHIHHVDNTFGYADRLPYTTPIAGLYSCSAGCHPAGGVTGAAGHNAAMKIMRDMELGLEETVSVRKMEVAQAEKALEAAMAEREKRQKK